MTSYLTPRQMRKLAKKKEGSPGLENFFSKNPELRSYLE